MPVISFVSPKGGAGKTTAALILATELHAAGHKVTLIDADPNLPLMKWAGLPGRPENLEVIQDIGESTIVQTIIAARGRSDFVIVDLEGTASGRVTNAIMMSNLVLIPLQASGLDMDQAARSTQLITSTALALQREIPYAIVFTRVPAAARIRSRNYKMIAGAIEGEGIRILQTPLAEREAYKSLFLAGGTIDTLDKGFVPSLETAKANAVEFANEVAGMLADTRAAA
jgi:chromosome partitioning protein